MYNIHTTQSKQLVMSIVHGTPEGALPICASHLFLPVTVLVRLCAAAACPACFIFSIMDTRLTPLSNFLVEDLRSLATPAAAAFFHETLPDLDCLVICNMQCKMPMQCNATTRSTRIGPANVKIQIQIRYDAHWAHFTLHISHFEDQNICITLVARLWFVGSVGSYFAEFMLMTCWQEIRMLLGAHVHDQAAV